MSIAVELSELCATIERYGHAAYAVTSGDDGRPHVAHIRVRLVDGAISVPAGRTTRHNAAARGAVVLLWPPYEPGGFSLIVDADALDGAVAELLVTPTHAVLHRPA